MSDFGNSENASDSESESCASSWTSTTKSTKRLLPNKRKYGKISKEDETLDTAVGVLKKFQDQKEEDPFDVYGRHVAYEFRVINNALAQNWAKFKIQEVFYQAKLTTITP